MSQVFIKQADPGAAYLECKPEIDEAIFRVLSGGWFILGPEVEAFEREFASYVGTKYAVAVGTGTDAIFLALRALGIGVGDEVITVSHTAVATVAAIRQTGAIPVFVDVSGDTYTLDVACLGTAVTSRTKAIVPVHLYGHPADMAGILAFAERHGLAVLEDCAQAHGATITRIGEKQASQVKVGSMGTLGAFSFYPTKNLGALGDGGCVVTNDAALAERLRLLRQYGWKERYISEQEGWNSRLDEVHAAVLRVLLRRLDASNSRRKAVAACYDTIFDGVHSVIVPFVGSGISHVYHQYVVRVKNRDSVMQTLRERGIGTAVHYPVPVHLQPAYRSFAKNAALVQTEELSCQILSLPMYPQLSVESARCVGQAVRSLVE